MLEGKNLQLQKLENGKATNWRFVAHNLDFLNISFIFFMPYTLDSSSLNVHVKWRWLYRIFLITYPGVPYTKYCWWRGRQSPLGRQLIFRNFLKMHFKLISTVNLQVDWHLTVHHSRRYAEENISWHGFTSQRDSYSFILLNDGFRASSSFEFATVRYLHFLVSFSHFIHKAYTQIKTSEIPISLVAFKPFCSRKY